MVCFKTYSPPGHYCVNNWWVPEVANINMTFREDEQLLVSGTQGIIPGPSQQTNESTSVSTENVNINQYFYHDSSLSNEAINRNDEGTVSGHNSTTEVRSNQIKIINSEQGNRVEQAIQSLISPSLLFNNEPGTTDYSMTMRQSFPSSQRSTNVSPLDSIGSQFGISEGHFPLSPIYEKTNTEMTSDEIQTVEMNRQIENYGQDTINNLITVHLGNTTNNFAIGEAVPNQLSDIPSVNTVNYSGSVNNGGRMNKLKVEKSQPECNTETSENEFAFPDRIEQKYQKESTMIISNPGASELITDGHAFAGPSRLQQNVCNSSLRSTEFQSKRNLKQHSVVTSGQKLFSCKVCQKGYKHESTLKCHKCVHADIKPYECKFCGKAFTTKCALKTHVLIHTDEKSFICDICGKGFTQNGNLKAHMRTHTEEKPYSCLACGKSFTQKSNLKTHERVHTGEKPYKCEFCGSCQMARMTPKLVPNIRATLGGGRLVPKYDLACNWLAYSRILGGIGSKLGPPVPKPGLYY
ncbi:Zinc finger protein 112 [Araneus ventricosus]|uniref:Zinc finger protein 112 n=1 Tax=Araneus ventricosus TaxID=182803 RepID=A0A4Y2I5D4_ARAVE|nr:Zinc finger protein 112 [Araneus ventricosus]